MATLIIAPTSNGDYQRRSSFAEHSPQAEYAPNFRKSLPDPHQERRVSQHQQQLTEERVDMLSTEEEMCSPGSESETDHQTVYKGCSETMDTGYEDDVASVPYSDYYDSLKEKEEQEPPLMYTCKENLEPRKRLVEWMSQLEDALQVLPLTIHLAVAYLDRILAKQVVHPDKYQLIAAVCVWMAAKIEETETNAPLVEDLNKCCAGLYTPEIFCKMEIILLNKLDWKLALVTPRHWLELFLTKGAANIRPKSDRLNNKTVPFDKHFLVQRYQRKYAEFFTDLCLQEQSFACYRPSIVAAASLAAARRQLSLSPAWPRHARKLTGFSKKEIKTCLEHAWSVYRSSFPEGASW